MEDILDNNAIDLIQYLYTLLKKKGMWFTQKKDPTYEEPKSYYKLDEYGELTDASAKQVEKEIEDLIGDGAFDIVDALNKWVDIKLCEYKIAYKEFLVSTFKQKEVVDGLGAYECRQPITESQKLQEDEYDEYMENERKLADEYKARVKSAISVKAREHFQMLKDLIDSGEDKIYVDGWYYPNKAVYVVKSTDLSHHLNPYMDLNVANILNSVRDNASIEDAIDELFDDYKAESAYSWADNLVTKLDKLDFSVLDDLDDYNDEDYEEVDESKQVKKVNESMSMQSIYDTINQAQNPFQIAGAIHSMGYVDGGVADVLQDQYKSMKNNNVEFQEIKDKLKDTVNANILANNEKEVKTEAMISKDGTKFSEEDLRNNWIEELKSDIEDGETLEQRMKECPFDKWKQDLLDTNDFKKVEMKTENVKARLKEENNKSQNVISDMITSPEFDSESNQGKIVLRTAELFNALSSKGYDVQTTFDNGESQNTILLGQQGGVVNITITNDNQPLRAFTSGSFEVNEENIKTLDDIAKEIKVL